HTALVRRRLHRALRHDALVAFAVACHEIQRIVAVERAQRQNAEMDFVRTTQVIARDLHRLADPEFVNHPNISFHSLRASRDDGYGSGEYGIAFRTNDRTLVEIVELRRAVYADAFGACRRNGSCHWRASFPGHVPVM